MFLNFLENHARRYMGFHLRMESEVTDLIFENKCVVGVRVKTPDGEVEICAPLTVGADGRSSTVRERAKLDVIDSGAPIDVLWFRLPQCEGDPPQAFGHIGAGQFMVLLDRGDYWQCGYVVRKGEAEKKRDAGIEAFRKEVSRCAGFVRDRVEQIKSWDDVKLLTVRVDHLRKWYRDGLLCIGDSAHAMSPIAGVGINLAIQDAVATANLLAEKLRFNKVTTDDLQSVQQRRERAARITQAIQIYLHEHFLEKIFDSKISMEPPLPARLSDKFPRLRRIPARMAGIGFRPEHVRTLDVQAVDVNASPVATASV